MTLLPAYLLLALLAALLVLVTVMQTLYMEAMRLRSRETPMLEFFKETLEDRIDAKGDSGVLAFSLIKHTLIVVMTILLVGVSSSSVLFSMSVLLEAAAFGWITMIVCTYVLPQLLYRRTSGHWLLPLAPVAKGLIVVVRPLSAILIFLQSLAQLGEPAQKAQEASTAEESIEALISAGTEEGIIEEDDRRLIQSVVAFGSKTVREVMTPRPNMVCIPADATLEDLRQLVIHEQFSRIPVYEGTIDQIMGFVHVRDMFEVEQQERAHRTVREVTRPVRLVPETKPVNDLLAEMQRSGAHMAIVIDEYGNTAGVVTMEDMVEEIVGEIRDEHEPSVDVQQEADGSFIVSGSFDVDHLPDLLPFRAEEETESTTVGGLAAEWAGHVPEPGEAVERDGIRIEVLAGNELRVEKVRISKAEPAHLESDSDV